MRMRTRFLAGVALAVILSTLGAPSAAARTETFVAGKRVRMKVFVPSGYSFESETNEAGITHILMENPVWHIGLSVFISPEYTPESDTEAWQRNMVVTQSAQFLTESKEQDYQWRTLKPLQGSGVYCIFTDAQAKRAADLEPGGFMHVVVGAKVIKHAILYFQIYNNDLTTPEYREIFDVLLNSFDQS